MTAPSGLAQPWGAAGDDPAQPRVSRTDHFRLMRLVDWIWHVRGSVDLAPGQSADEAFERLDPLFRQTGTSRERDGEVLTFRKKDQAAQDKMSVFDGGTLRVENGPSGSVLRYHLVSRALLFCFLAPLLFLAFAQLTVVVGRLQGSKSEATKSDKEAEKKADVPMNPIDKFLGAPAPEKPKKGKEEKGGRDKKPSPTPGYVFAGMFAFLYVVGRILEDRLINRLFKRSLSDS